MGKRKGKAPKKPRAKETEIIQSENKLIENYNENICRALQTAIVAATEQYSPSLMGMMYGDIIPAAVWKMMFLCDRMTTDEERCTCLCLLTDYLSKECSSLGMLDSNSTATSLLGPTNNVLKTLATMWNNALLKYQSKDLYGSLFTQLSSNLQKSVKMFTLYGFQDYFIQPLKLLKEIEEGSVVISVRSDIPTIPNHSRINCQKLRSILYKAYSPRKDPYDDYFQDSHYKNNVWYKRRMSMLNGCDSDPEYIPDDSFVSDGSLSSTESCLDDLDDDSNSLDDEENELGMAYGHMKKTTEDTAVSFISSSKTQNGHMKKTTEDKQVPFISSSKIQNGHMRKTTEDKQVPFISSSKTQNGHLKKTKENKQVPFISSSKTHIGHMKKTTEDKQVPFISSKTHIGHMKKMTEDKQVPFISSSKTNIGHMKKMTEDKQVPFISSSKTQSSVKVKSTKQVLADIPKKDGVSEMKKVSSSSTVDNKTLKDVREKKIKNTVDSYNDKNARGTVQKDKTTSNTPKVWSMNKTKEVSTNKSLNDRGKITPTSQSTTVIETRKSSKDNNWHYSGWMNHNGSERRVNYRELSPILAQRSPFIGTQAITISSTSMSDLSMHSDWTISSTDSRSRHSSGTSSLGVMSLSSDTCTSFKSEDFRDPPIHERAFREIPEDFPESPVKAPQKLNFKKRISDVKVQEGLQKREQTIKELESRIKAMENVKPQKNFWEKYEGDLKAENKVVSSLEVREKMPAKCQPLVEREMNKIMKETVYEKRKRSFNNEEEENKPKRTKRTKAAKKPKCFCCKSPECIKYTNLPSQNIVDTKTPSVNSVNNEMCSGTARQIFPVSPAPMTLPVSPSPRVPPVSPLTTTPSRKAHLGKLDRSFAIAKSTQDIRSFFVRSPIGK